MNHKRLLLLLLVLALVLVSPIHTFADPPDDQCPSPFSSDGHHSYSQSRQEATCTDAGSITWVCSDCGKVYTETIPALGHSWGEWVTRQEATCTESGTRYRQCTRCNEAETEAILAKGHTPVTFPGQAATCTEAGLSDGVKCSVCGEVLSAQQTIPALGHSYQNGVCVRCGAKDPSITPAPTAVPVTPAPTAVPVTPAPATAVLVTPAPVTAAPVTAAPTQKPTRRPTARPTATPAPAPVAAPFSGMNIPSGFGFLRTGDPISDILRIVQQPQGGYVPRGSYTELTVEAAGGEGAYTYEWWYAPELPMVGASALTDFLTGFYGDSVATVSQAKEKTSPIAAQLLDAWKKKNGISGTVDHSVTVTEGTIASTETETMTMEIFNPLAEKLSTSPEPGCNAWKAGTYWCVVYDEAGHHATSDKVQVQYGLYISGQPESKNIYGLSSVTLSCRARGGSGNYAYTWYDGNGNVVSDEASFSTDQIGVYHCLVVDFGTNETVESFDAQVYSEEQDLRPTITLQPESIELEYREDGQYSWSLTCQAQAFDGNNENLQYQWSGKTDTGWAPIGAGETLNKAYDHGTFRCTVTDKRNGQFVTSNEAKVQVKIKFTMWRGIGYDSSEYNTCTQEYSFVGGCAPYTVEIYAILPNMGEMLEKRYKNVTDTTIITVLPYSYYLLESTSFGISQNWMEPTYYAVVTDSLGQTCTSETVRAKSGANWFGTGRTIP